MSRVNKYRGKRINKEEWIVGFYTQLPKVSLGATIVADGDLCAEDVADYIIVNKQKQHPNFSNSYPIEIVECEQYEVDQDTICQYTEVCDKFGNKIFEKDIVSASFIGYSGKLNIRKGIVEFINGAFSVNWIDSEVYGKNFVGYVDNIEVIGNIFENPELLQSN